MKGEGRRCGEGYSTMNCSSSGPKQSSSERFAKELRIRKRHEFDKVYAGDVFAADQVLVVRGCRSDLPRARLGLSVSRKVGNAVVRNRWKRLIREVFRQSVHGMPQGVDLVVRPRRGAEPDWSAIRRSLPQLARRISNNLARSRPESKGAQRNHPHKKNDRVT